MPADARGPSLHRPARPADAASLASLAAETLDAWSEPALAAALERSETRALLRECAGRAVAFALGRRVLDEGQILQLAVAPRLRERGLGRALLEAFLAALRDEGAVRVSLEVREGNRAALRLYESRGFLREGRRVGFYRDGEAALLLGRSL